ncbi:penicillin-binding protein activator [Marinobacter lutaoensis]|uniref:LppC family lipoprotein n=1 Tax=Marinobacter lutaoensis TaxID=135739 RepID=A0A1V2DPU2_9GAMM|nr:penicillin-binding protein activator [Marinobacter lutaoensis]ONF42655.1 LppC family lipoprotein [Marinobacter lutaoensis]
MMKKSYRPHALACLSLAFLLISGCANVNLQSHIAQSPAEALDVAAQESDREAAQRYLLRMASRFQEQGNHVAARTVLRSSQLQSPVDTVRLQAWLLSMASAVALDDAGWAGELAAQMSPDTFTGYPGDLMARAANLQAQTYTLAGRPLDGAQTLILLAQADPEADVQALHDQIWQALKRVPEPRLAEASSQAIGYESQGWLELAAQLRQPGLSLDDQGRIIRRWQNHWPGHPAAQVLPSELQLIAGLAASRPEKIALALPLDGAFASAGKAIRDGFLAAYYLDASADRSKTDIRVFNTATRSFASLYSELASQDFDLIVGPLEKEALSAVAGMNTLPVPVLGLNYLPEGTVAPEGLYQYGLSAEDEARQIADRLSQEHLNQVLVLIPRGDWGDRVEKALLSRLREDGGAALDVERFFREDNLRTVTADVLGITASRERAIQVERTIGVNVEFEPRRRQDADAIVMVAEPTVARQFKPLFAFYFGGDLPVYAPSIVYEGTPNPARDRDLNGVTFTDIPWVLAEQDALRRQAQAHLSGTHGQLGRLFAMGADAWQLSKRLPLLRQVDGAAIDGQTGRLTMTPDGRVHREQLWARFENGRPKLLTPTPEEPAATD